MRYILGVAPFPVAVTTRMTLHFWIGHPCKPDNCPFILATVTGFFGNPQPPRYTGQFIVNLWPELMPIFCRITLRSFGLSPWWGSTVTTRQPWCPGDSKPNPTNSPSDLVVTDVAWPRHPERCTQKIDRPCGRANYKLKALCHTKKVGLPY